MLPPISDDLEAIFHILNTLPVTLSATQYQTLYTIAHNPALSVDQIAAILGRERTYISKSIKHLCQLHLVEKHITPPAHKHYTTAEGEKFFHFIDKAYKTRVHNLRKMYPPPPNVTKST